MWDQARSVKTFVTQMMHVGLRDECNQLSLHQLIQSLHLGLLEEWQSVCKLT